MVRYWVIAPYYYGNREAFEKAWDYCRRNGVKGIGWDLLGDLSLASKEEIKLLYQEQPEYRRNPKTGKKSIGYLFLQRFWHDIELGDIIVARAGLKKIVATGVVFDKPYFDPEKGRRLLYDDPHPNLLPVRWANLCMDFNDPLFSGHRGTVDELKESNRCWREVRNALDQVWIMS